MSSPRSPSRRKFLKSSAALSGGLLIGVVLPEAPAWAQAPNLASIPPNAFVHIAKDGTVTVMVKHLEFGQGVSTSLPMLVAEELDCDWSKVRYALAPAAPEYVHTVFGIQMVGGSSSVWSAFEQMRTAGAQARAMLVQAAAEQWKVKPETLRTENGFVIGAGGRKLSYGQLAEAAARVPVPQKVALKDPKAFRLVGKPTRRIDSAEKVEGKATFGLDVQRKNLHVAMVAHPPAFGAQLKGFDAEKVKKVPGVSHVVEIETGVAVVATNFWAAKKARDALELDWDPGPNAKLSTADLRAKLSAAAKTPGPIARKAGNAEAIKSAAKTLVAEYEVPFLAHAPMEPLNCTVEVREGAAEIWVGTQFQTPDQQAAAQVLGLKPEQVTLHTMLAGGGFGRRANPANDYVVEACEVAKRVKVPVKLIWTREDDIRAGWYRPMYVHRVEVGLDAQGKIVAWNHTIAGPSILTGTAFESMMVKDGIDATTTEGIVETPYAIPNLQLTVHRIATGVPVQWWRSVGHSHNAFALESMLDEVAAASGKDPLQLRRELLAGNARVRNVLDLAAAKAGWGSALPKGRARGLAVHESFGSICAQVAEVSLDGNTPRVHRVVAAFDCGRAVNPLTIEAQVQGAIAFGLGPALFSEITVKDGASVQSNFHDYRVLRLNEMPAVEVHLVPSEEKPGGVGEVGVPPVAPAVANAFAALTGRRVRTLPLGAAVT
jgi:isoquinoline 1-oxidoreductase beta subunit